MLARRRLSWASVNSNVTLLTRVIRINDQRDKVLLNMELVVTDSDGRTSHDEHAAWVSFADGTWEFESAKVHANLSELLEDRFNSPLLFGMFGAQVYQL
jgi:hypothetical protein